MFKDFNLLASKIPDAGQFSCELPDAVRIGSFARKAAEVPAIMPLASANGICFEINEACRQDAHTQMQYMALSVLKKMKPECIRMSFVDISLNTNFPLIQKLKHPNLRFITNRNELKAQLTSISESVRYLSSSCLVFDYVNLQAYNAVAEFKEAYHLLFVANFPKDFRDEDMDMLFSLITEATNCGVYVVLSLDRDFFPQITDYNRERYDKLFLINQKMITVDCTAEKPRIKNLNIPVIQKQFDAFPFVFEKYDNNGLISLIEQLNLATRPETTETESFLSLPIGFSGREQVFFELGGKLNIYHTLLAGQNQTGKSTFLNNLITNIALNYSPDEFRLYLLDYKQGVEFEVYEHHPNVEVLLLDNSKIEFAIQILQKLNNEIPLRAAEFKRVAANINNIRKYNKEVPVKMPRILLIIDEVQEIFEAQFQDRNQLNKLVKTLAKQGAAFGIHLFFCTQSFASCALEPTTRDEFKQRVAFTLGSTAACRAILGNDNEAPMNLAPYHCIYNANNGHKKDNRIVKTLNFDNNQIVEILQQAAQKYTDCQAFERTIIRRPLENAKPEVQPKVAPVAEQAKKQLSVKSVQREGVKSSCTDFDGI